jgi:two-component system CheB/CheR fusion protein
VVDHAQTPGGSAPRLLELFVHQTPDLGIIFLDLDRRVRHWLGASEQIFGYSSSEIVGQVGDVLFTEEDRKRGLPELEIDEALRAPRAEDDRWHVRKNGSRVFISGSAIALRDEHGSPLMVAKVLRDHTDRRAYVETLEHRLDERDRARAYKEVSVAALAHELRNPLAPLKHAMQLVRMACKEPSVEQPLAIIDRQMAALQRLVDDLVEAGRVAAGRLALNLASFDLNEMLAEAAAAMRPEFERRGIDFTVITPNTPILVEADKLRLQQVTTNLLSNAARYTPRGGRVWLKSTVESNLAVFRVQDTGVGLDKETLPFIFNLFTRGPQAETLAPSGMGIGLSIVKHIVEQHHGALDVRSEGVGMGAEFSVHLPFTQKHAVAN